MKKSFLIVSAAVTTLSTLNALALNISQIQGDKTTIASPQGRVEICAIAPKIFQNIYSDSDLKDEKELCAMDFYRTQVLCPKQNSTNPGVLVAQINEGQAREQALAMCKGSNDDLSIKAKFKSSISCSYTPAILAYYHFSRILKAGRVPVAVLRTMDKDEHLKIVQKGIQFTKDGALIHENWENFANQHTKLNNYNLFDGSREYVYGALTENPKKEMKYTEVSGVGGYETRYQRFLQQTPYLRVADKRSVQEIAGSSDLQKLIPVVVQMKDVSDMILLDTLFSQDDRIGNIHFKYAWYYTAQDPQTGKLTIENKGSKAQLSSDKKTLRIPEEEKDLQNQGAVLVKEMLLKDNDCGVNVAMRTNMMRKINALEGLRHISPRTYQRFMNFYKISKNAETLNWMKRDLLFTDADLGLNEQTGSKSFLSNLEKVKSVLVQGCKSGTLKLDLNLDQLVNPHDIQQISCE